MPKGGKCAEIGVWKGDFSARILEITRPTELHLIDPWQFITGEGYDQSWYGGSAAKSQADMDVIYGDVLQRFDAPIHAGTVVVHRIPSSGADQAIPDRYFDWVYIDANHLYEFVKSDLELFSRKVRPGGYVAGDDYGERGWWENGVTKAVDEFVASGHAVLVRLLEAQFILRIQQH
jgi:hypothetical protein